MSFTNNAVDESTVLGYDPTEEVEEVSQFGELFEPGTYLVTIQKAISKRTYKDDANQVCVTLVVADGPRQGDYMFCNVAVSVDGADRNAADGSPQKKAYTRQCIGRQKVNSILKACDVVSSDLSTLINKQMLVTVTVTPAKGEYKARNDFKAFAAAPPAGTVAMPTQQAAKPSARWAK